MLIFPDKDKHREKLPPTLGKALKIEGCTTIKGNFILFHVSNLIFILANWQLSKNTGITVWTIKLIPIAYAAYEVGSVYAVNINMILYTDLKMFLDFFKVSKVTGKDSKSVWTLEYQVC